MLSPAQLEQIRRIAEEIATREGCILYDLEFREGPGRSLRVFIDKSDGGVSLDDCVNVSNGLNLRLDVEDLIPGGRYELEVSSPGMDRKLTQEWHYAKAVGEWVRIQYRTESGSSSTCEGRLLAVRDGQLDFENAKGPWSVAFSQVMKGQVILKDGLGLGKKPARSKKKRK